jgi:protein-L-isoaspartate(D-aspartate) O-methyltransferase
MQALKSLYGFPVVLILLVNLFVLADNELAGANDFYDLDRKKMVSYQLKLRGIEDQKVLNAMETVLRHEFVPSGYKSKAYADSPLPIGYGQTISQPYIVALMTQLLKLNETSTVLEIGTGSGYQAAVLARIVKEVYSVEIVAPLYERSNEVLKKLGYKNIHTINKDGYFGWKAHAPYDAIIVTCAADFIPPPLIEQLKPGGLMCIPVGPPFKVQHLVLVEKKENNEIITKIIASVRFVPLIRKEN